MKRFALFTLCFTLVLGVCAPAASANSWGLTEKLLEAVSADRKWNGYIAIGGQAGDVALMHKGYHNALMVWNETDRAMYAYTKAVYQPDDDSDGGAKLQKTEDGFTLAYGDGERYAFVLEYGVYTLREAVIGDFRVAPAPDNEQLGYSYRFLASDGTDEAALYLYMPLGDFNIRLFPRSVDEVRQLNLLRAALQSGSDCLGWVAYPERPGLQAYSNLSWNLEPVYSAPYPTKAWRAAGGRAAVGLQGELWALKSFLGEGGQGYTCIRYDLSASNQRIGYIPASVLGIAVQDDSQSTNRLIAVPVQAAQDTYLTDDPDVSQYPEFDVPAGTAFTCLGLYSQDYAYVGAKVNDKSFTADGQTIWGFVPLKALALAKPAEPQADAMRLMLGPWVFTAGGNMADDELIFREDGTFTAYYLDMETETRLSERRGTWTVTRYEPDWKLYWSNPPYELTLTYDSGEVTVRGLSFYDQGFSLSNNEGGGGYERASGE